MKSRLTIDVSPLFDPQWTGIPIFTRRLIKSLQRDGRLDLRFACNLLAVGTECVNDAIIAGNGTFLRQHFDRAARRVIDTKIPVFYPSIKKLSGVGTSEASTVHDLSTLVMPENHKADNVEYHLDNFIEELSTNDITFCVSDATKKAMEVYYPSYSGSLQVVHQFADWPEDFVSVDCNLPAPNIGRYAVVIGTLEPRKNLAVLLRSLELPEVKQSDLKFVVIGKIGWHMDRFIGQIQPEQRKRLHFTGFVSEFSKYRILAHSEFMIFPSMYEGFGIPALEALSLGKPVIASLTSSFPEVVGDAGLYFDPASPASLAQQLQRVQNRKTLSCLQARARSQSEAFNWQRMARPVVDWAHRH